MLKLTRAANYALHALVYMAGQKKKQPVPSHHIAADRGIPERFLLKVLKPLVSTRVLLSIKGPHGGYLLAKPPGDISLLEVLEAVDGPIRGQESYARDETDPALNRRLEDICNRTADQIRRQLQKVRLTDLAGKN